MSRKVMFAFVVALSLLSLVLSACTNGDCKPGMNQTTDGKTCPQIQGQAPATSGNNAVVAPTASPRADDLGKMVDYAVDDLKQHEQDKNDGYTGVGKTTNQAIDNTKVQTPMDCGIHERWDAGSKTCKPFSSTK